MCVREVFNVQVVLSEGFGAIDVLLLRALVSSVGAENELSSAADHIVEGVETDEFWIVPFEFVDAVADVAECMFVLVAVILGDGANPGLERAVGIGVVILEVLEELLRLVFAIETEGNNRACRATVDGREGNFQLLFHLYVKK